MGKQPHRLCLLLSGPYPRLQRKEGARQGQRPTGLCPEGRLWETHMPRADGTPEKEACCVCPCVLSLRAGGRSLRGPDGALQVLGYARGTEGQGEGQVNSPMCPGQSAK